MITKNELAHALIESYSPSVYKKSQLVEGSRRNKQSLYGMSQFNLPEPEEETSNSADSSFSELDVQDIIYEFYVNKRNPTSADIAKLQSSGIWTIPTVDCYWKYFNEAAKHNDEAEIIINVYNTPQALYAHIKKDSNTYTYHDTICKSKYLFVSSSGAILSYIGYNRYCFETLDFVDKVTRSFKSKWGSQQLYSIISDFITDTWIYTKTDIRGRNNRLSIPGHYTPDTTWIKSWWEDTYGIKFTF